MKKILSILIAACMIICVGIKFNVLSMNTRQDQANRVLIERWQALLSDINRFEERLANATTDEKAVLELILHNLRESRDALASDPHIQRYKLITDQQPIRTSIPAIRCKTLLRPKFITFLSSGSRKTIRRAGNSILAAALSPDGNRLALGLFNGNNTVRIRNINRQPQIEQNLPYNTLVRSIAWSHDGNKLATASDNGTVRIWNTNTLTQIGQNITHNAPANVTAWSHDNNRIATGSNDGIVSIWNAHTQTQIGQNLEHEGAITSLSWSPDDSKLATASGEDGILTIWDTNSLTRISQYSSYHVRCVAWSPDGSKLAIGSWNGLVNILNAHNFTAINANLSFGDGTVESVAWSPDSNQIALAYDNGEIFIWNTETNTLMHNVHLGDSIIMLAAWSLDGTTFAIVTSNKIISIWHIVEQQQIKQFLASLNIEQCDLLRTIDMAMQQTGRVQTTDAQWQTFTTFPEAVQRTLRLYIKQPPAGPTYREQNAEIEQRIQQSATSTTTKQSDETISPQAKEKTGTQEPMDLDNDDHDDDDNASSDGKKRARNPKK